MISPKSAHTSPQNQNSTVERCNQSLSVFTLSYATYPTEKWLKAIHPIVAKCTALEHTIHLLDTEDYIPTPKCLEFAYFSSHSAHPSHHKRICNKLKKWWEIRDELSGIYVVSFFLCVFVFLCFFWRPAHPTWNFEEMPWSAACLLTGWRCVLNHDIFLFISSPCARPTPVCRI